ncbi:MAG: hypothetical protein ACK535_04180, partial [Cyanobacteriota bacterium]
MRNAIPTEADFADLIAASLNQADDGVLKLPEQPLGLVRQKPDQPLLRFFADPAAEGSVWQVQLGAGDKPGFGLAAADGKLALFVDGATGNVGIGTAIPAAKLDVQGDLKVSGCFTPSTGKIESSGILFPKDPGGGLGDAAWLRFYPNSGESCLLEIGIANDIDDHIALMPSGNVGIGTTNPGFKLDVNGTVRLGGFTTEEKDEGPNIVWCRDLNKKWDEGLIKHGNKNSFFNRAGFGVHIHESRSFEMFSSNWKTLLGIEGGSGNTSIRGQTNILTGSNPIRFSSSWTGFPD